MAASSRAASVGRLVASGSFVLYATFPILDLTYISDSPHVKGPSPKKRSPCVATLGRYYRRATESIPEVAKPSMRVCPQCARKNKPRAKFCDHCGFEFVGYAGSSASTQRAAPPPAMDPLPPAVDPLPPSDTAKGVHRAQPGVPSARAGVPSAGAGVPQEVSDEKGIHRQTQKLELTPNGPVLAAGMVASGIPTARTSHNQETIKVARVPAPARASTAPSGAPVPDPDAPNAPEPEATIQGAFYLRKQEATRTADVGEPVGWLVESTGTEKKPGAIWPVVAGITLMGSSRAEVGTGVVADRPDLAHLHALIFHRDQQTWLVDLGSGAATLCNGVSLSPLQGHPLSEGDEIRLGELILSFRRAEPQPGPPT